MDMEVVLHISRSFLELRKLLTPLAFLLKMKIKYETISREMIKPSAPTPNHLRHYQFSYLDQTAPPFYISLIYFYHSNNNLINTLKSSLSNVLTKYYPLAGRIKNNYIHCNDEGVILSEAKVSCQLSEIIHEPELTRELKEFLPFDQEKDGVTDLAIAIQVNLFKCGSVAIATTISHKIGDASSLITFMNNWAATARGESENVRPEIVAASLFPPKDADGIWDANVGPRPKKNAMNRFMFEGSKIAALREKFGLDNEIHPTRVEALSAFIWSRIAASTKIKISPERPCVLFHPVNLRKRMEQPLPDDSFGNIFAVAVTFITEEVSNGVLVKNIKDAISKINKDHVKDVVQPGYAALFDLAINNAERIDSGELIYCDFSSLCKFPVYEADFGWGKPMWVAWGDVPYKNIIALIDTKSGDGIEAWVQLEEEDMVKFQTDKELLAYVSPY